MIKQACGSIVFRSRLDAVVSLPVDATTLQSERDTRLAIRGVSWPGALGARDSHYC